VSDSLDPSYDLDLAATSILADTKDVRTLLKVLAGQLAEPLGERLKVERQGGLFHKSDEVKSIIVNLGDEQFSASVSGPSLECVVAKLSGGIKIRSERVEMQQWLSRLLERLKAEAAHSQSARLALENIVIGGPQ